MASSQAETAKVIRATLKAAYPSVTFRVRSRSASMMDAVHIRWTDGPTTRDVESLIGKHEYGHFDGMIDLYEYSNVRDDIPQVKYVQTDRDMSPDAHRAIVAHLNEYWGYNLQLIERTYHDHTWLEVDPASDARRGNNSGWQSQDIYREFQGASLICRACNAHTLPYDAYCPQCGNALTADEQAA